MTAPTYAGTTSDGAALTLVANEARQATDATPAGAQEPRLRLATPDGAITDLSSATAVLDRDGQEIVLSGGVRVNTSSGYQLETAQMVAQMDRSGLQSDTTVKATGPLGEIVSGGMTLSQDSASPGAYLLVFNGGVRLIYLPGG
jgi:lipopolysaccharide export system protein LptC